ncbi:hypothetical protein [Agilicoccus flavus]|uniref:hypothetical protein n=1 Tax=Agilicoccus flavus TaxID=2775968 RepID=UPI001CF70143|nr:hypothetical protein [Agilicoccus flavus]
MCVTDCSLPAETFTPGSEPSGHFLTGPSAAKRPFPGQPVQGFSATHRLGDDSYLVMGDNGFGAKANSQDADLAVHRIRPGRGTEDTDGTPGTTTYINTMFTLSDPNGLVPWRIWRDGGCGAEARLPAGYTCPKPDRKLTGWDFDVESMQVARTARSGSARSSAPTSCTPTSRAACSPRPSRRRA